MISKSDKDTIISLFDPHGLGAEERTYLTVMAPRFSYLLGIIEGVRKEIGKQHASILDIGPSFFTALLRNRFSKDTICTMGFVNESSRGGHLPKQVNIESANHYTFDLNETQKNTSRPVVPPQDIIVFAEVIEHLHTSPKPVLAYLHSITADGGFLVLQTPNAVSLRKRWAMLKGKNPFEKIRENRDNPGHFREYTLPELKEYLAAAGFSVEAGALADYFPITKREKFIKVFLPRAFRDGITIVAKKG